MHPLEAAHDRCSNLPVGAFKAMWWYYMVWCVMVSSAGLDAGCEYMHGLVMRLQSFLLLKQAISWQALIFGMIAMRAWVVVQGCIGGGS